MVGHAKAAPRNDVVELEHMLSLMMMSKLSMTKEMMSRSCPTTRARRTNYTGRTR